MIDQDWPCLETVVSWKAWHRLLPSVPAVVLTLLSFSTVL